MSIPPELRDCTSWREKGVLPAMKEPPFSKIVSDILIECVDAIRGIEEARGDIARADRSSLAVQAQPYQDFIDRLFYVMAGLTKAEADALARLCYLTCLQRPNHLCKLRLRGTSEGTHLLRSSRPCPTLPLLRAF
jgi:hypothetical protein